MVSWQPSGFEIMKMKQCLKGVGIALIILVITMPVTIIIVIITHPFWLWFEKTSGIESYGHSGPAEWCYWFVYFILLACATYIWSRICIRKKQIN